MPEESLRACAYHVLRYTPNLVRDEWVNIGILIHDPGARQIRVRLIEEPSEFARVRRLHPDADENLLRALETDFEKQFAAQGEDLPAHLAALNETLSNVLQLSPQKGVLTEDMDAELDRLYRDHVAPPRYRPAIEGPQTRAAIRTQINRVFARAGVLSRMEKGVRVEGFTHPGDPLRLDYSYRRNGTRGFVHALVLARDPAQAKVLAYTATSIRAKLAASEFYAVTEVEPQSENERHRFITGLLGETSVSVVAVARLEKLASELGPTLQ